MIDRQPPYFKYKGYLYAGPHQSYDYSQITVSGGVTNYVVESSIQARYLEVSVSGAAVGMRLNSASNASIPIANGETRIISDFSFENLYFTTSSGSAATVSLFMLGYR